MPKTIPLPSSPKPMIVLSQLLLQNRGSKDSASTATVAKTGVESITRAEFDEMLALADANHVLMRGFDAALGIFRNAGDQERSAWTSEALEKEHARIQNAVSFLHRICGAFQEEGLDATVIKSLDHWPDLGSDLDMYTNAEPAKVIQLMARRFQAQLAPRSWGDRLACKWNFVIPGLPESVEIHMGRLGQTGEQITLAERLPGRARQIQIDGLSFRVPHVSDRLMISTLQRMYRHFYFRLCDIIDSTEIAEAGAIDFSDLQKSATTSGIWEGVATYLAIVSDYVEHYRGVGLDLPRSVTETARFGGEQIYFAKDFLRVPILPQSARLYGTQLGGLLLKGELQSSARLGLLPWLATAAAVGMKITGSDKGIW